MKLDSSLASRPARRAVQRLTLLATLWAAGVLLAGCGQKGSLTLPKPAVPAPATSAASAAAPR